MNKKVFRVCCISKQKAPKENLIRITKFNNQIFINNQNIQGRSVYFLKDKIKDINVNKFFNVIKSKLKFNLEESDKIKIMEFIKNS
ncbi:MAG: DUF448 domain-containing protein [Malacoplasma sp.]|nr:DUF448 domain-containing protein [Malacoplasma sp.]